MAVGLGQEQGTTPFEKNQRDLVHYPWGETWPPPVGCGNYDPSIKVDEFEHTSPVGSFPANRFGVRVKLMCGLSAPTNRSTPDQTERARTTIAQFSFLVENEVHESSCKKPDVPSPGLSGHSTQCDGGLPSPNSAKQNPEFNQIRVKTEKSPKAPASRGLRFLLPGRAVLRRPHFPFPPWRPSCRATASERRRMSPWRESFPLHSCLFAPILGSNPFFPS